MCFLAHSKNELIPWRGVRRLSVCKLAQIASSRRQMAGSLPNFHKMDSRSACIQDVLKVKVKGHVIRALSWILGMSYSIIDGLVMSFELHAVSSTRRFRYMWFPVTILPTVSITCRFHYPRFQYRPVRYAVIGC